MGDEIWEIGETAKPLRGGGNHDRTSFYQTECFQIGRILIKFKYKVNSDEQNVGFVAEDVPELVATKDRKGMSPMDVVAVLTSVL